MILKICVKVVLALCCGLFAAAVVCSAQSGWTSTHVISGGKDLNAVYFSDSKRGWVCGDGGFLAFTDDGGATWVERRLGTDHAINDVYFVSKDRGFALSAGSIYGVNAPERAATSQASASARMENIRAKPQPARCTQR
jgi:photosystem II stability/assembly factor-like uncharacterized protein